jgi:phage/plasmid-like protein (TIGR03299 family)
MLLSIDERRIEKASEILHLKPSRGLGSRVAALSAAGAMRLAGLDWQVEKRPVLVLLPSGKTKLIEELNALVRTTDNRILGTVGNVYQVSQNINCFSFFDFLVEEKLVSYHSAGSLNDGNIIWLLVKIRQPPIPIGPDTIEKYILLTNSHDGKRTIQASFLPIRMHDGNIISISLDGQAADVNIRHSKACSAIDGPEILHSALEHFSEYARLARFMAEYAFTPNDMKKYISHLLGTKEYQKQVKDKLQELFLNETAPRTAWAAWMAICTWCSEYKRVRNETDDRRLEALWVGHGYKFRQKAFAALQKAMKCV